MKRSTILFWSIFLLLVVVPLQVSFATEASGQTSLQAATVPATTQDASLPQIITTKQGLTITVSPDQKRVKIEAKGNKFAKAKAVSFPTWSDTKGQDDIIWHKAKKKNGVWVSTFSVAKHKDFGTYSVHAYATIGKRQKAITAASFTIARPQAKLSVESTGNGCYTVRVSNIASLSGVNNVTIPSWTNSKGKDDLVWHAATKDEDGTWFATIEASEHGGQTGTYVSRAYIECGNGLKAYIGKVTQKVKATNYAYITGDAGSGMRTVAIKNPSKTGTIKASVWSSVSNKKDLVRYKLKKGKSNLWTVDIDCSRLKSKGAVNVEIAFGKNILASTSFKATKADLKPSWKKAKAKLKLTTNYHKVFYHGNKPKSCQKYIMLHDTEGDGDASGVVNWWVSNGQRVAAHFIVNKDGTIVQCVPLDTIAHHAGFGDTGHNKKYGVTDESRDDKVGTTSIGPWAKDYGMNSYSIGIEMVHVGGSGYYPKAQLKALDNLIAYIDAYYGKKSKIIDHKAWRSGNSDTSPEFAQYLANYKKYRKHTK